MAMHIGHVAMRVTDLERSVAHALSTLDLMVTSSTPQTVLLTSNAKHHELQLIAADQPGLDHVGLEVETEAELDAVRNRLVSVGARILSETPQEEGIDQSIRTVGPAGVVFEIYTGMTRSPLALSNVLRPLARKLGHVTMFSDYKTELEDFILNVLGFRVSDRWGQYATWMRCDADHHGLAVGKTSSGSRLHHYAFELEGWGAIGYYADRISRHGQQFLWGPGRHGPGFNIFTYLPDPEGAIVEVYTDLLRIDDDKAYNAVDWADEPRAMNLWGPLMPSGWDDFGVPILDPTSS